jgi:small nuclear ribonucleoprotein D3
LTYRLSRALFSPNYIGMRTDSNSVPVALLYQGEGLIITIETKNGSLYRGQLECTEDNMSCSLKEVSVTDRNGRVTLMERVYIRGSEIVFVVFPPVLKHAPMFKRVLLASKGVRVAAGLSKIRQQQAMSNVVRPSMPAPQLQIPPTMPQFQVPPRGYGAPNMPPGVFPPWPPMGFAHHQNIAPHQFPYGLPPQNAMHGYPRPPR